MRIMSFVIPRLSGHASMIEAGVVGDFRAPDILRFGIHPLVNSYLDIDRCLEMLRDVLADQRFKDPRFSIKQRVT